MCLADACYRDNFSIVAKHICLSVPPSQKGERRSEFPSHPSCCSTFDHNMGNENKKKKKLRRPQPHAPSLYLSWSPSFVLLFLFFFAIMIIRNISSFFFFLFFFVSLSFFLHHTATNNISLFFSFLLSFCETSSQPRKPRPDCRHVSMRPWQGRTAAFITSYSACFTSPCISAKSA